MEYARDRVLIKGRGSPGEALHNSVLQGVCAEIDCNVGVGASRSARRHGRSPAGACRLRKLRIAAAFR